MSQGVTLVLAAAAGLTVANIYYNQPLLGLLQRAFDGDPAVGFVPTATQSGYALGLVLLLPLGDRVNRRGLIVAQMLALSLALLLLTFAPSASVLLLASFLLGITSTVPQQIIPFAADLASPARRGAVLGTVMSGLLCGILLARTAAGLIGSMFGWRATYGFAIVVSLATAAVLAAMLPSRAPSTRLPYLKLLGSTVALIGEEPKLRLAAAVQTGLFASFSVFWTILALRLEQPPFGLGPDVAGLFGVVGVAGVLAAPLVGKLADRYGPQAGIMAGVATALLAWVVLGLWGSLAGLVLGVILLDAGAQGSMIGNQHIIFALRPEARNRINTVFMGAIFIGGACGSAAAMVAWRQGGWPAVCVLGGGLAAMSLVLQWTGRDAGRPISSPVPSSR